MEHSRGDVGLGHHASDQRCYVLCQESEDIIFHPLLISDHTGSVGLSDWVIIFRAAHDSLISLEIRYVG